MSEPKTNFAKNLKELEAIVDKLEQENVDLDTVVPNLKKGMELAAILKEHLQTIQNQVEVIKKRFDAPETTVTEEEEA